MKLIWLEHCYVFMNEGRLWYNELRRLCVSQVCCVRINLQLCNISKCIASLGKIDALMQEILVTLKPSCCMSCASICFHILTRQATHWTKPKWSINASHSLSALVLKYFPIETRYAIKSLVKAMIHISWSTWSTGIPLRDLICYVIPTDPLFTRIHPNFARLGKCCDLSTNHGSFDKDMLSLMDMLGRCEHEIYT